MRKLFCLVVLLPLLALSQSNESVLMNMTEISVKHGHNEEFIQGMKAYKKCFEENGGTYSSKGKHGYIDTILAINEFVFKPEKIELYVFNKKSLLYPKVQLFEF